MIHVSLFLLLIALFRSGGREGRLYTKWARTCFERNPSQSQSWREEEAGFIRLPTARDERRFCSGRRKAKLANRCVRYTFASSRDQRHLGERVAVVTRGELCTLYKPHLHPKIEIIAVPAAPAGLRRAWLGADV